MKNKVIQILIFTLFMSLILNSNLIKLEMIDSIKTFIYILFPSIFPFFLISNLLIYYNFHKTLNKVFGRITNFLFHTSNSSNFVIIMSLFSGFPSGSKYIRELLDKKLLTIEQANYLITFTHFSNPLFVLSLTTSIFNNIRLSYLILFSHIFSNFIIAFIVRPRKKEEIKDISYSNDLSFSNALTNSIKSSLNILTLILGNTCFFFIVSELITNYMHTNTLFTVLINGFFDITKGIQSIHTLNINYIFKSILVLSFLSFGGININMQVKSIISGTKIKYKYFLFGRISQTGISIIIFLLLMRYTI